MKETLITAEKYLSILNKLIPKGWIPIGKFGSMQFHQNGKNYDLSAADLEQLERIESEGLFLIENAGHLAPPP